MKVVSHPFAGKILVARRDLPKGYKVRPNLLYAATLSSCPQRFLPERAVTLVVGESRRLCTGASANELRTQQKTGNTTTANTTSRLEVCSALPQRFLLLACRMLSGPYPTFGVVDPVSFTGSVVQFMGCPGPNEVQNCILTGHYFIEKVSSAFALHSP